MALRPAPADARRFEIGRFAASDMILCGSALRRRAGGSATLEAAAQGTAEELYESLRSAGEPACALVRFYYTLSYSALPADLQRFARSALSGAPASPELKCLTLLGSAGALPEWNDRRLSDGHKAIPLPSPEAVMRLPMVFQLVRRLGFRGVDLGSIDPDQQDTHQPGANNLFYVQEAAGSPFVPAQAFVEEHGIRSVVGFGATMLSGDLFAVILFMRVPVPLATAQLFRFLAGDVKAGIVAKLGDVFTQAPPA